ncbi:MAG TPA: PIG-L family deacetylase [Terriglobia bacterium]|nr:PIG-L family deacetylase [Terriglobia bacterium]
MINKLLALAAALPLLATSAWPQTGVTIVTDQTSYNVGSVVRVRVVDMGGLRLEHPLDLSGALRYAGETRVILHRNLARSFSPSGAEPSTEYQDFWTIPRDARTGRYEIALEASDSSSHQPAPQPEGSVAAFVVHRKLVEIKRVSLDKTFYTSGDHVAALVSLKNAGQRSFSGLRVEFSKRYWPWTAQSSERAGVDYMTLADSLALPSGAQKEVRSARAAVAEAVKQPTVAQYAVVVWDQAREHVLDIAFTPIVFINPPGVRAPRPYTGPPGYPMQYLHPNLNSINTSAYRHFYPPELDSTAIQFDTSHTMFASGSTGTVSFSLRNPTESPWHSVSMDARVAGPQQAEPLNPHDLVDQALDLERHGAPVERRAELHFPGAPGGLYRFQVELRDSSGAVLAAKTLELGVNPLPKSILIFCAHEDDEGAHAGIIRAAVENHIPIHFVYFTNGDAGSCDRYYQHFCGPAEALNFGALRMDEARGALGHVGVPREDIFFLGLPDGGSGEVWHHVEASHPYPAVLLAVDHAPYEDLVKPNLPFARDSVVQTTQELIKRFQPEVIYTGHPDERHVDHRTNNWFVVKALQELLREGSISPDTILLTDQSYGPGPQAHAPYHYAKNVFYVSGEAMALQQEAGWFYQSQGGNTSEGHLRTFDKLRREQVHWQILDWKDHEGWNESR